VGCEGEGEFKIFLGGVLTGGTKVVDELMELLEVEVHFSQIVDGGVGLKSDIEGGMEAGISQEKG